MENVINPEYGTNLYTPEEIQRMEEFREAAGHIFSASMIRGWQIRGFFRCPASLNPKYHGNHIGGLYDHSMEVYRTLQYLTESLDLTWQRPESPLLIGIFHDWVKLQNYIQIGTDNDQAYTRNRYSLLSGHGEVSIILAQQFLQGYISASQFTTEELACIRYHMGAFTNPDEWNHYTNAIKTYPNVLWTHTADMVASQIQSI